MKLACPLILLFLLLIPKLPILAQEMEKAEPQAIIEVDADENILLNGTDVSLSDLLPQLLEIASQYDTLVLDITFDMAAGHLLFDQVAESYIPIMHLQQVLIYYTFLGDPEIFYNDQDKIVKGRVVDNAGKPLSNVTIFTSEAQDETLTNRFGDFIMKVSPECEFLIIYEQGFEKQKVIIQEQEYLEVVLQDQKRIW